MPDDVCPCGSGGSYADCCGRFIEGAELPRTAEELMRSRYSAYVRGETGYLVATWHPTTRPANLDLAEPATWLGLRIVAREAGGAEDATGVVEFVARYKIGGKAHRLHEHSRFRRHGGRWVYIGAEPSPPVDDQSPTEGT
jgi:SEC-C motif-containing protein